MRSEAPSTSGSLPPAPKKLPGTLGPGDSAPPWGDMSQQEQVTCRQMAQAVGSSRSPDLHPRSPAESAEWDLMSLGVVPWGRTGGPDDRNQPWGARQSVCPPTQVLTSCSDT